MKTEVVKKFGVWVVQFTQGVQTFHIPNLDKTKKHANWQKEMLDKAFDNFKAESIVESLKEKEDIDTPLKNMTKNAFTMTEKDQGEKEPAVNFMQIRELTDEEWLKLPKEEILQLYKNCYAMLQNYIKLSGEIDLVNSWKLHPVEQVMGTKERKNMLFCETHGINYEPPQPKDTITDVDLRDIDEARESERLQ